MLLWLDRSIIYVAPLFIHIQIWNLSAYNYENELEIMNSKPQWFNNTTGELTITCVLRWPRQTEKIYN